MDEMENSAAEDVKEQPEAEATPQGLRRSLRNRKKVERLDFDMPSEEPFEIVAGEGAKLESIPAFLSNFASVKVADNVTKKLHRCLYKVEGKSQQRKKDIRSWSGVAAGTEEAETARMTAFLMKNCQSRELNSMGRIFGLKAAPKAEIVESIVNIAIRPDESMIETAVKVAPRSRARAKPASGKKASGNRSRSRARKVPTSDEEEEDIEEEELVEEDAAEPEEEEEEDTAEDEEEETADAPVIGEATPTEELQAADVEEAQPAEVEDVEEAQPAEVEDVEEAQPAEVEDVEDVPQVADVEDVEEAQPAEVEDVEEAQPAEIEEAQAVDVEDVEGAQEPEEAAEVEACSPDGRKRTSSEEENMRMSEEPMTNMTPAKRQKVDEPIEFQQNGTAAMIFSTFQ